jgi:carbon storage regulator
MLVLSRKPHEAIVLPDQGIRVRVLSIKGNTVRIGIEAPLDVNVVRAELLDEPLPAVTVDVAVPALQLRPT